MTREAFDRGYQLHVSGRLEEAKAAYREAADAGLPEAACNLAEILEDEGDVAGAEAQYRRADQLGFSGGAFGLAQLANRQGRIDEALGWLRRADSLGDVDATMNLGLLLKDSGDLPGALDAYRRAEERGDRYAPGAIGQILVDLDAIDEARHAYKRGLDAGDGRAGFWLGGLLYKANRVDEARAVYERAAGLGDEHAEAVLRKIEEDPGPTGPGQRWSELASAFEAGGAVRHSDTELMKEVAGGSPDRRQRVFIHWALIPPALEMVRIHSPFARADEVADLSGLIVRVGRLGIGSLGYLDLSAQTSGQISGLLTVGTSLPLYTLEPRQMTDILAYIETLAVAADSLEVEWSRGDFS